MYGWKQIKKEIIIIEHKDLHNGNMQRALLLEHRVEEPCRTHRCEIIKAGPGSLPLVSRWLQQHPCAFLCKRHRRTWCHSECVTLAETSDFNFRAQRLFQ